MRDVPTELPVGLEHGLKAPSVAQLDALQTVAKERLGRYVGSVGPDARDAIREALLFALDLDR